MNHRRADFPVAFCFTSRAGVLLFALLASFSACASQRASGDSSAATARSLGAAFECRWASSPVTIDGQANEPAWAVAQVITNFSMPWMGRGAPRPPTATRARLLWDREFIYFHAEMEDWDVYADVKQQDGMAWLNDVFELFFKPAKDRPGYYEFEVNAANTRLDMFLPSRGAGGWQRFKSDGDFHLKSAVVVNGTLNNYHDRDTGWSVEGRIPWKDFAPTGGRPEPGEEWTFALCRYDYSIGLTEPALSTCVPLQNKDFHNYEGYAPLRFIGPKLAARPQWNRSRVVGSPDPPPPFRAVPAFPKLKTTQPVFLAPEPGSNRLLLIEVTKSFCGGSRVRRFRNSPDAADSETLLELPDEMTYGLAFHPGFATNGFVFLGCNGPAEKPPRFTRVVRYTMERTPPFRLDSSSRHVVIEWPSDGHNGGDVCFGNDGMLYATSGDGTSDSDDNVVGQDLSKLTAKVLRIDVDHADAGRAYCVPSDNPFLDLPDVRPETWAYGLRNPWRITSDPQSGQIWVAENGQDLWESARLIQRGANYGWSVYEGSHPFYLNRKTGPQPLTPPTLEHSHAEARSLTGGVVYRGGKFAELRGAYLYGDYGTGKIWGALHDGRHVVWRRELADTPLAITHLSTDQAGNVLVTDYSGNALYRLGPTPATGAPAKFPLKLSETGLFLSTCDLKPQPALIPYSVNSPLWSDGAHKQRWLAIPGAGHATHFPTRGFDFPEGTVLVKQFDLDLEPGGAASPRRLETRLLTKQQNEWVGYTYVWNDAQDDATLLGAAGADREFIVRDPRAPGGVRKQIWHFPSRAECLVCHSRAARFVLGLTEAQLNREHDYAGWNGLGRENQLAVFERLGLLEVNLAPPEKEPATNGVPQRVAVTNSLLLARPPARLAKLADPADAAAPLDARARAYLQANCAHCHVRTGGGNAAMELEAHLKPAEMKIFDERPVHQTYGLADARLVAPGDPARSVLLHRIAHRDAGHMPPLATTLVDEDAVNLLRDWIRTLKAN